MQELPSYHQSAPSYTMTVELNATPYIIKMNWNSRTEYWHTTISDNLGGSIAGVKVVAEWPLLKNHRGQITLEGELMVLPTKESAGAIGYDSLGKDYVLVYMTPDDMVEWEAYINGIG